MLFLEIYDNSTLSRLGNESNPESRIEEKMTEQILMTLVPNPASDKCELQLHGMKSDYVIFITNIVGEKVFIRKVPVNVNAINLDTQAMPAGIYFVSATDGTACSKTSKLVIAR